ncbi:phage tail protein [Pseudomonas resinovorans]|uniref:Phage tail protein n=1 Tax=Metapseudomonas resinovorans TaxID=53412 RepID=A0ABT4Y8H5_METRE|nr:phage tail protein [Pseudomonas resinovorans]MDA8485172.1 phage tail protein [Pseudomonas resinovorans]
MSTGQILGGGLGAVIGGILAAPTGGLSIAGGAALGFQTGMAVGGYLDPPKGPTVYGPRLGDKSVQTSTYGTILTRYYGTISAHGNATWLENGELKETVRKKKQGGKGGGSVSKVETYTYSATFFLSLGEGEIAGIRRMWCQDKLIYNAGSDDLETIIASNQAATGWKLYRGTDDQLPDPRYEADVGVGNAPAYRGEAYIAFYDFQLADFGNSLQGAQFKVEVVATGSHAPFQLINEQTYPNQGFSLVNGFSYDADNTVKVLTGPAGTLTGLSVTVHELFAAGNTLSRTLSGVSYPEAVQAVQVQGDLAPLLKNNSGYSAAGVFYPSTVSGDYFIKEGADLWMLAPIYPLIVRLFPGAPGMSIAAQAGEYGLAKLGGYLYALKPGQLREIDAATLVVQRTIPMALTLPGSGGVNSRFFAGDGALWHVMAAGGAGESHLYKLTADFTDVEFIYELPHPAVAVTSTYSHAVANHVYTRAYLGTDGAFHVEQFQLDPFSAELVPLADIVEQEIALSSLLTAADVDTSLLTAQVRGYRVSGGSIRSALEPPQGTWPFDMIQSGYVLKPVPRGQASVMIIPWQDLGASDGDAPGDLLQESREMDSQLPARTSIKYLDAAREYAIAEQSVSRDNTPAINRVDRELPIVLTADEAAGVADVLQNLAWLERSEYAFSLPPIYLALEPADVVTIVAPWATFELRLTEINYAPSGRLECKGRPNRAALYTSTAKGGEGVPPSGTIPLAGPTLWLPLDIPVVDETIQDTPGFGSLAVGYNPGWPGAVVFRSIDGGQTWSELQGYTGIPSVGYARGTLPASACALIDQRSLVVDLIAGELESITRDQMLAGQNYAAYGIDGRWEIVRFQNATLQADGSYLLSHFVRGDRGTEWATGLHQAGDFFVLLDDPDNVFVDMAVGSIGVPATYRGVTSGASIDSASDVPFTYQGVNLECLSPVYARGSRDGSGNFSGAFTRRSRLSSSWWTNGVEAPLGETTQAYEVDVMSGSTVKRTITASTPSFDYSAANQTADFGSPQAAITFRIYQMSSVVGRGYPLEVTL